MKYYPNIVKVVMDKGFAMYFSRAPIPFYRDGWEIRKQESGVRSQVRRKRFEILNIFVTNIGIWVQKKRTHAICFYASGQARTD
jgi:CMP-2-keto-3-deoxyoctulosonic acid synthetase